jgi:hypothetical protein
VELWGGIILAVLGLLTALITNLETIGDIWEKVSGSGFKWDGTWIGVHQYPGLEGKEKDLIHEETLNLRGTGSKVSGNVTSATAIKCEWDVSGIFRNEVLILTYTEKNKETKSLGAIVVQPVDIKKTTFIGFWLGVHETKNKLVACPYVLTKEDVANVKQTFDEFLHGQSIVI